MKTAVVFYSYSGNTNRIAHMMIDFLKSKDEEAIPIRIRPLKEETNFIMQCRDAFLAKKPELYQTLLDLKDYDRIIIGSPVWAFKPAPSINTYLDKCSSLAGKRAVCFVTYGSGAGKDKTLASMKKTVESKGANVISVISFQQAENAESCIKKLSGIL